MQGYDDWKLATPPEYEAEPEETGERETHWSYGGGSVGCLYDCGPSYAPSKAGAIEALAQIYDLTDAERETLDRDCILYFDATQGSAVDEPGLMFSRRLEAGADYCEVSEQDGPCPEDD